MIKFAERANSSLTQQTFAMCVANLLRWLLYCAAFYITLHIALFHQNVIVKKKENKTYLFCSLAVLDPRVGHTMDVLSPFIPVLCHSDWFFHGESCPRLESWCCPPRPCVAFLAFVHLALFLAISLSPGNSLVSSWCDHSMLASLLWLN